MVRQWAVENSSGLIRTVQPPEGICRLRVRPQLGPGALLPTQHTRYEWRFNSEESRQHTTSEQLRMGHGVTEWFLFDSVRQMVAYMRCDVFTPKVSLAM